MRRRSRLMIEWSARDLVVVNLFSRFVGGVCCSQWLQLLDLFVSRLVRILRGLGVKQEEEKSVSDEDELSPPLLDSEGELDAVELKSTELAELVSVVGDGVSRDQS
ncbi:hypothetical protein AKJ16_DCAP22753 [Drosera capensis]